MVIQKTALFLKLDTDDPHAFPRHTEMAVKWKHLSSGFMLAFFIFSVHQEEFKKKKKIYDSLFFKDAASSAVFQVVFGKDFLLVYALPTEVLFISQVCVFMGPSANFMILFSAPQLSLVLAKRPYTKEKENVPRFSQCH